MMSLNKESLIALGARTRLAEIEQERQALEAILDDGVPREVGPLAAKPQETRRLHWTQRPENRQKVLAMHRKAAKTRKRA